MIKINNRLIIEKGNGTNGDPSKAPDWVVSYTIPNRGIGSLYLDTNSGLKAAGLTSRSKNILRGLEEKIGYCYEDLKEIKNMDSQDGYTNLSLNILRELPEVSNINELLMVYLLGDSYQIEACAASSTFHLRTLDLGYSSNKCLYLRGKLSAALVEDNRGVVIPITKYTDGTKGTKGTKDTGYGKQSIKELNDGLVKFKKVLPSIKIKFPRVNGSTLNHSLEYVDLAHGLGYRG